MAQIFACCGPRCLAIAAILVTSVISSAAAAPPESDAPPAQTKEVAKATDDTDKTAEVDAADSQAQREAWFEKYMTGATLEGRFTIVGRDSGEMPEEKYTIVKCEKLEQGNLYRFTSRIKYGDVDQELPLDLPVEWAGDTPVISLTNLWIPGLGTFSTRLLIYRDSYAGTWSHGEVGGHMFGTITKEAE